MLNLRQIEVFRAIMIAKTVTGAAQLLHVSQPGLSRMLKHMEVRLGIRLFDRAAGRLLPTLEAEALFEEIQKIYKHVEGLDRVVQRIAAGHDSVFRLGASPSLGVHVVPSILRQLKSRFPHLTVHFDILGVGEVIDYLVSRQGEYALTVFPVSHPNIATSHIGDGRFVCVVPRAHPLSKRRSISIRDLAHEPLISFGAETPHGRVVTELFRRAGLQMKIATYVRFAETACAFVREGVGVSLVDEFTASALDPNQVCVVPIDLIGRIPLMLNRAHYATRSQVSDEFERLLFKASEASFPILVEEGSQA